MRLKHYCPNTSIETITMNTENSKTNEPHKFVLDLISSKFIYLLDVENYKKQYKNNKLKIITST